MGKVILILVVIFIPMALFILYITKKNEKIDREIDRAKEREDIFGYDHFLNQKHKMDKFIFSNKLIIIAIILFVLGVYLAITVGLIE